jgi:hypothetical protein
VSAPLEDLGPRSVEGVLEQGVDDNPAPGRDHEQERRESVVGQPEEQRRDEHDGHHDDAGAEERDLEHHLLEQRRLVRAHPLEDGLIELLSGALAYDLRDLHERPRAGDGKRGPRNEHDAECRVERADVTRDEPEPLKEQVPNVARATARTGAAIGGFHERQ